MSSLHGHHAHTIEHEAFTLAGWEIDRELEAMVTSIEGNEFDDAMRRVSELGIPRVPYDESAGDGGGVPEQ